MKMHHVIKKSPQNEDPSPSPHIILLHGFLGSGRNLNSLAVKWTQADPKLCVAVATLLGHGDSDPLEPQRRNLKSQAEALLQTAIDSQATQPVHLFGHSMGGLVALYAKELYPQVFGNVLLLDIAPRLNDSQNSSVSSAWKAMLNAPALASDRQTFREYFLEYGISKPVTEWLLLNLEKTGQNPHTKLSWKVDREALAEFHQNAQEIDLWNTVKSYAQDIEVIRGATSNYVDNDAQERFRKLNVPVHTIDDAGHFVHAEQLKALLNKLLEFKWEV